MNDETETARFFRTAPKVFEADQVKVSPKLMPAEDFAYYLKEIPGRFIFVGAGNPDKAAIYPHHHPMFDFDEDAMRYGAKRWSRWCRAIRGLDFKKIAIIAHERS